MKLRAILARRHTAEYPAIEFGNRPAVVRDAEVTHPASDVLSEFVESVFDVMRHGLCQPSKMEHFRRKFINGIFDFFYKRVGYA